MKFSLKKLHLSDDQANSHMALLFGSDENLDTSVFLLKLESEPSRVSNHAVHQITGAGTAVNGHYFMEFGKALEDVFERFQEKGFENIYMEVVS